MNLPTDDREAAENCDQSKSVRVDWALEAWLPIDTAPKDGTEILLLLPVCWNINDCQDMRIGRGYHIEAAWYVPEKRVWLNRLGNWAKAETPTHWMPLLPPPV